MGDSHETETLHKQKFRSSKTTLSKFCSDQKIANIRVL